MSIFLGYVQCSGFMAEIKDTSGKRKKGRPPPFFITVETKPFFTPNVKFSYSNARGHDVSANQVIFRRNMFQ